MLHIERFNWFLKVFESKKENYSDIKVISDLDGDFGDLKGLEFNSDNQGGYIHFWSSGYVGFQLVDFIKAEEIFNDTLVEVKKDQSIEMALAQFIKVI